MNIEKIPEISVILVNYNDKVHLEDCLSSIQDNAQDLLLEIIVVDNNSSDGSQEFVRKRFTHVRLIQNRENVGFSKANNQGIRESRGEFILFLNTDTIIYPQSLEKLLKEIKAHSQVGAVGPALLRGDKKYQISFGRNVSFVSEVLQKTLLNSYYRLALKFVQKRREVGWLSAACLMTRRDVLKEVGFFDENFFLYFEDIDLCYRIKRRGWKLLYLPSAKVLHKGGASTLSLKLSSRLEYRKSQLYFYGKHNSKASLFLLQLYLALDFAFFYLWGSLRKDKCASLRAQFFQLLKVAKKKNGKDKNFGND